MKKTSIWPRFWACVLMLILIVGAVFVGMGRYLKGLEDAALNECYYDDTGASIWNELNEKQGQADNLLIVAKRYSSDEQISSAAADLERAKLTMENSYLNDEASEKANLTLNETFYKLSSLLQTNEQVSEKDASLAASIEAGFKSHQYILNHSSYNEVAKQYNDTLTRLPYSMVASIMGMEPAGIYNTDEEAVR